MRASSTIVRIVQRMAGSIPDLEPVVLVALAVFTASLWGFIKTTDAVFTNETETFDKWVLLTLRDPAAPENPIGPPWMQEVARDVSALGGVTWIAFATIALSAYLWIDGKIRMGLFLIAATISGAAVSALLKSLFARPRPDVVPHLSQVYSSSFPSGHSLIAAVVYLTLGSLIASVVSKPVLKFYVLAVAVLLTTAVGLTRIYLGVHYPSDVLAGWLAGLVWALLWWLVAHVLQRRGDIERDLNISDRLA